MCNITLDPDPNWAKTLNPQDSTTLAPSLYLFVCYNVCDGVNAARWMILKMSRVARWVKKNIWGHSRSVCKYCTLGWVDFLELFAFFEKGGLENPLSSGSNPSYLSIIWNYKKHLKFSQKEESINYLPFSTYFILQSNSTHSLEFTDLKLEIKFWFTCFFIVCWIRIRNNINSGSREKFRIHADPDSDSDPQNC